MIYYASNEYLGTQNNLTDGLLSSAVFCGFGQGVSSIVKTTGYSTMLQATKFNAAPKSIVQYGTSYNGRLLTGSIHLSNATSSYSSFGQSLYNLGSSYFNTLNSSYNSPSYGIGSFK